MKITVFDLETTSKNPVIAEIITGFFETYILNIKDGSYEVIENLSIRAKPEKYREESFRIHGISEKQTRNFMPKKDALREICRYSKKHDDGLFLCHASSGLYGHNGYYDRLVIFNELLTLSDDAYYWASKNLKMKTISTHTIAKKLLKQKNNDLKTLSEQFNLGNFQHHNEVEDVNQTWKLFLKLIFGMNYLTEEDVYDLGNFQGQKNFTMGMRLI